MQRKFLPEENAYLPPEVNSLRWTVELCCEYFVHAQQQIQQAKVWNLGLFSFPVIGFCIVTIVNVLCCLYVSNPMAFNITKGIFHITCQYVIQVAYLGLSLNIYVTTLNSNIGLWRFVLLIFAFKYTNLEISLPQCIVKMCITRLVTSLDKYCSLLDW